MNPNDKLIDKYHLSLHESQFLLKIILSLGFIRLESLKI